MNRELHKPCPSNFGKEEFLRVYLTKQECASADSFLPLTVGWRDNREYNDPTHICGNESEFTVAIVAFFGYQKCGRSYIIISMKWMPIFWRNVPLSLIRECLNRRSESTSEKALLLFWYPFFCIKMASVIFACFTSSRFSQPIIYPIFMHWQLCNLKNLPEIYSTALLRHWLLHEKCNIKSSKKIENSRIEMSHTKKNCMYLVAHILSHP